MRYDAEHKARSRARILEAARARFRRDGFAGASIDQVMKDAGLTRGAFYAHFGSKDALVQEVLAIEAGLVHQVRQAAKSEVPADGVKRALAHYLHPSQRDDVASGCPLVAHPVDVVRGTEAHRQGYRTRVLALVEALSAVMSRDEAMEAAVLAVGAALMSAAVGDGEVADRVEAVALARVEALVDPSGPG